MAYVLLNRLELRKYKSLRSQVREFDEKIREIEDELEELNKCIMNISPVLTGMPSGNEKRDKIAEFVIKLEDDRQRMASELSGLNVEKEICKRKMKEIRNAINKVPNKQARDIIRWHFLDGMSIWKISDKTHLTLDAVYKNINKYMHGNYYSKRFCGD